MLVPLHYKYQEHWSTQDDQYRILAIDPGTDTVGLAVIDLNLSTEEFTLVDAYTLQASRYGTRYEQTAIVHGDRLARIYWLNQALIGALFHWAPHSVVCEAAYMRKFAQAYAALTQATYAIREAVWQYNPSMPFHMVEPTPAKIAVDAKIIKGDSKDPVQAAVRKYDGLTLRPGLDFNCIDEHAFDAIAIGIWRARSFLGTLPV